MDSGSGTTKAGQGDDEKLVESSAGGGGGSGHHHHHYHYLFHHALRIIVLFATVSLSCLVLYHAAYPFQIFPTSYNPGSSSSQTHHSVSPNLSAPGNQTSSDKVDNELERVLKEAATVDKTVIITTLNEAWAAPNSIFDIFLESFRIGNQTSGLLNHLVVIALDQKAYARCLASHPHCYALSTDGIDFSGEAFFMTTDYLKMMWKRIDFLRTVLDMGFNFIFTDADIMWFRDPFQHFYSDADFQIACDFYRGSSTDINSQLPNGGFTYVKSNTRTTHFYKFWYTSRQTYPGLHDQDVLNKIKNDPYLTKIGLHIRFLDTKYFGGFCEPSRDFNQVCTMHANCCVGLDNKVHDLKIMLDDWRKYMALSQSSSWTVPQRCGAASFGARKSPKKNETQGSKS